MKCIPAAPVFIPEEKVLSAIIRARAPEASFDYALRLAHRFPKIYQYLLTHPERSSSRVVKVRNQ